LETTLKSHRAQAPGRLASADPRCKRADFRTQNQIDPCRYNIVNERDLSDAAARMERRLSSLGILSGIPAGKEEEKRDEQKPASLYKDGARGGNRTRTPVAGKRILSPLRLPVSPPGHIQNKEVNSVCQQYLGLLWGEFVGIDVNSTQSAARRPIQPLRVTDACTAPK
jgi:hypothetical protein